MSVEVIQVIHTHLARRGRGTDDDPVRIVDQYWTMDGQLLVEFDPEALYPVSWVFKLQAQS